MANDQREVRLQKLDRLRAEGVRPYADRYPTTHTLLGARGEAERIEGTAVRVAGRVMTARSFGKLTFATLQDASGRCQVALDETVVGAEALSRFDRLVDLGDFVGVEGTTFQTKKGEPTVKAKAWTFLSKALRPLPEKWHGLSDRETCYRERHLDLLVNPETRERFRLRSRVVRELRAYLDGHGFEEVDTPVLAAKATGALARPFLTHHNALDIDLRAAHRARDLAQEVRRRRHRPGLRGRALLPQRGHGPLAPPGLHDVRVVLRLLRLPRQHGLHGGPDPPPARPRGAAGAGSRGAVRRSTSRRPGRA